MKVAQNDETNPNTQLSPSGSSVRKRETPKILSRMFPPFAGITYYRVWAHLASRFVLSCIDMHLFTWYSLFLPPLFSPVDYETDADATEYDYVTNDPSLSEQPGKPPL